ncbi:MAG: single-stranded DNA-binding protein [Armatimonadetes bacterium]|nr:single-stranded DNA-binding protein [Armatimonadota bacterium]
MQLNRIVLIGRLTNDPEERFSGDGMEISKFRIAVNRMGRTSDRDRGGDREREADFFNVVCFRHTAKFVNQYLRRGNLVAVEGRLQIDEYTDREGLRKQWIEVQADNVQNLTPRGESASDDDRPRRASGGGGGGRDGGGRWEHYRDFEEDEAPAARAPRGEAPARGADRPRDDDRGGGERPSRRQSFPKDSDEADPFADDAPRPPKGAVSGGSYDSDDDDPFADE